MYTPRAESAANIMSQNTDELTDSLLTHDVSDSALRNKHLP
jgi:hypothetical protein